MIWGKSRGRRAARRASVAAPSSFATAGGVRFGPHAGVRGAPHVAAAARQVVEQLESRVFLHAGENHLLASTLAPYNGQQRVAAGVNVTVTFAEAVNAATLTPGTFELRDGNNNLVPAAISYNPATRTATLDPKGSLAKADTYFTAKVKGGTAGVLAADGTTLDGDLTWSFTTGAPTFTETTVFGGLDQPTAIQFAPDGRAFVAEKSGLIKVFDGPADATPTVFADLRTQTHNFWDRGLLGLALDPQFAAGRPYVYVLYAYDGDVGGAAPKYGTAGGTSDPGPDATGQGARVSGRLSRLTAAGDAMVPGSEKVLVNDWQQQFPSHSVGSVAFGPDGALYASAGDGASFDYADYGQGGNPFNEPADEGGALRSQDLLTPDDPTSLAGSIIRVNPDTGAALPDNPLYAGGSDANAKRIVAEGFRNPFRFAFRPGTNELWAGDVGWNGWEEIDRLAAPTAAAATATGVANYGWPAYEGPGRQDGYDALNLPVLESLYARGPGAVVAPYFAYRHTDQVVPGSGEPTGGSSISGIAFYPNGGNYPAAYRGALFFADYARAAVYVMYAGPDGLPDPASRQVFKLEPGQTPAQLTVGPDGNLYAVDVYNGDVRRFQFFGGNRPPVAAVTADRTAGPAPLTVHFSGAASSDPDAGDALTYAWDLDGDGQYDDSTAVNPSRAYTVAGTYQVGLKVTDRSGAFNTAAVTLSVGNDAPTPTIVAPLTTLRWKVGQAISFAGTATDPQQGTLPGSSLHWELVLRHENLTDPANYHEHLIEAYDGAAGSFVAPDHPYPSRLELRLTATDAGGLSRTVARVLDPQTATLTFTSNVAGATVGFNDETVATPFSRTVIVGSANSVAAPAVQAVNGRTYAFAGWSDGAAAAHTFTAGAAGGTYTVTYTGTGGGGGGAGGDVTAGLVDRYQFDEGAGTTAADAVGGNNARLVGGAAWAAGKGGSAVSLDGVDDYVRVDASLAEPLGESATVAAWIKTTQVGTGTFWATPGILGVEKHYDNDDIFYGILDPAGRIGVQAGDGAAATSTTPVNDGKWHHVAFTRDGATGQLKTYVDGVLQATAAGEPGVKSTPFQSVGRIENTAGPAAYLKGALDDVRIYGRVLTAAEVAAVTAAGSPPPANAAPTVAKAAKVSPAAPLVGVPAALSAIGADDGGEAKLKYTWSVASAPAGAAAPKFGTNGSNAAKNTTVTFATAGSYTLRCTVSDGSLSVTSNVAATVSAFGSAKVNFQPAAAATVSGYLVDSGNTFGTRNNAQSFGWNVAHTSNVFDRAKNGNQLLDTVVLLKAGAKWELAVPNGTYTVKVSVGDPSAAATNTVRVEGTGVLNAVATAANAFQNKTVRVVVTDGRLTLDNGAAAASATRLNYVEVTRTGNAPAAAAAKVASPATASTAATSTYNGLFTRKTEVNGVAI